MLSLSFDEILRLLDTVYFGNEIWRYLAAGAASFATFTVFGVLKRYFARRGQKYGHVVFQGLGHIRFVTIFLVSMYAGLSCLTLPHRAERTLDLIFTTLLSIQVLVILGQSISVVLARTLMKDAHNNPSVRNAAKNLGAILKFVMWLVGLLFILSNLGLNIASLIAGLGIGGIAIALATQSVLSDTFSSFVIFFDQPFQVGESIAFGDFSGTVEEIGLRTTRLRAPNGDQLIVANSDLTKAKIVKPRTALATRPTRVTVKLRFAFDAPRDALAQLPAALRDASQDLPQVSFDRANFAEIGAHGLIFESAFSISNPEDQAYRACLQEINFRILRTVDAVGLKLIAPALPQVK